MAQRKVITIGQDEEFLRKKSKPVTNFDESLWVLLDDMWDTLEKYNGAGLSAVQVGVLKRMFIVGISGREEFINPQIIERGPKQKRVVEGCLSVPKKYSKVMRPTYVKVRAQDRFGKWFEKEFKGYEAQAVYHESDHLDGILYIDLLEGEE